jgi:hypothetical protein
MGLVMKIVRDVPKHAYINVMELLVSEEVEKQLKTLQPSILKYLKRVEVETYALNRLPSLYASSQRGWQLQYEKAKRELHNQIKNAVRQAFAAVQVDPIRSSQPLQIQDNESAKAALDTLRDLLKQPELNWEGVVNRLQVALGHGHQEAPTAPAVEPSHRTRYRGGESDMFSAEHADDSNSHYWRPGTYGSQMSWQKRHPNSGDGAEFDWSDPRYSK